MDASPETFAAVADLIRLIADPDGCAKRVTELRKLGDEVAKAQSKLDADRAEHSRKVAADTAELAEREAALRKRHVACRSPSARSMSAHSAMPTRCRRDLAIQIFSQA
jgi:hypothetical protein